MSLSLFSGRCIIGSHAQDKNTQTAASQGAQANDQQLASNAAQNQNFANNARSTLFGSYDPSTNKYSGGSASQYLDPNSQNTKDLSGSYQNEYNNLANQNAQATQQAVGTSQQNLASRGMGATPAGFAADQQRQAYQTQAGMNGQNYSNLFGQQHQESVDNYRNATNLLNSNSTGASNLSVQGNSAAANNYGGLYGNASQQVQSTGGALLGAAAGLGAAYLGRKPCWVAAEVFGGWHEPRTVEVRTWLLSDFSQNAFGRMILNLYVRFGERIAASMRSHRSVRWFFTRVCNAALRQARKGA